jgi:hypothetical protein
MLGCDVLGTVPIRHGTCYPQHANRDRGSRDSCGGLPSRVSARLVHQASKVDVIVTAEFGRYRNLRPLCLAGFFDPFPDLLPGYANWPKMASAAGRRSGQGACAFRVELSRRALEISERLLKLDPDDYTHAAPVALPERAVIPLF